ncbi:Uncharacterised protein [Bifidobacterium breve]|nr:hypothetical protein [Bifidobacterium breve]VUX36563.1 Uncharacterised protein [Bifidobacterium breve]
MCKRENAADALADLQAWVGEPFDAAGRRYDGGKESVDRFWKDLKTDQGMSVEPRYVELAFGCPPIEWDIDMRVRDFADRMSDEYTSLYEQDTTGIKGGDFERFGAFADNHLDFMRALTKARGMDPISRDREIGAFLNTFDKLAAMPEPSPAAQEKDDFSAGVCDPAGSMTPMRVSLWPATSPNSRSRESATDGRGPTRRYPRRISSNHPNRARRMPISLRPPRTGWSGYAVWNPPRPGSWSSPANAPT